MSLKHKSIHSGWKRQNAETKQSPTKAKQSQLQRLESQSLVLYCRPDTISNQDWQRIEAWIRQTVPCPGHRLQVLIYICTCRQSPKPLQLRLTHELAGINANQRSRVSLRQHNHQNQLVRLEIILRQTVRLA